MDVRLERGARADPPRVSPEPVDLCDTIDRLHTAQTVLRRRSIRSILDALSQVAERWLSDHSPWMERAIEVLPEVSGYHPEMLRTALPTMIEPLRAPSVEHLIARELGSLDLIDEDDFEPPRIVLHILPSNIPALAAIPISLSHAIKSSVLVKPGRNDPVFATLWHGSLAEVDSDLAAALAIVHWPGGDRRFEDVLLSETDVVVAGGSDATIDNLRGRATGTFLPHGHRISFAVLADGADENAAARGLATDVATWDQRGCLSPRICFVEGKEERARTVARRLHRELGRVADLLPPGAMSNQERTGVRRFRDSAQWRGFSSGAPTLFAHDDPAQGSISLESKTHFQDAPTCRCLRVTAIERLDELPAILSPHRSSLEACGLAATVNRLEAIRQLLRTAGVPYITEIGRMQQPDLSWQPGGRPRIADWIRNR